ncbi:MAG: hydrocarbon binding protein (contains V4R domain) [Candidatus Hydrothermarchaeota archaeon]
MIEKDTHFLMTILGSFATSLEDTLGFGAKSMSYNSGKSLGIELASKARRTEDLNEAIDEISRLFEGAWEIELFKRSERDEYMFIDEDGRLCCELVFRHCPIRNTLMREGIEQEGILCYLTHGYIVGALGVVLGKRVDLEIEKAGINACLKKLIFEED